MDARMTGDGETTRRAEKRDAVLDAAKRVLARDGVDGFSVARIAREAGVAKATFFYYFADKRALIAALAVQHFEAEVDNVTRALEQVTDANRLPGAMFEARVRYNAERLDAFRLAFLWPTVFGVPDTWMRDVLYPLNNRLFGALAARLSAAKARGEVREDIEPRVAVNLAMTQAQGVIDMLSSVDRMGGTTTLSVDTLVVGIRAMIDRAMGVAGTPGR